MPEVCTWPPAFWSDAPTAKYPASVEVQVRVVVVAAAGTGKLPLATTWLTELDNVHFSVSAEPARVVIASLNAVPDGNRRVLSALGVSAVISPLPEDAADVVGDTQLIVWVAAASAAAFGAALRVVFCLLAVEARSVLSEPPPQPASAPASAIASEERSRGCFFIGFRVRTT